MLLTPSAGSPSVRLRPRRRERPGRPCGSGIARGCAGSVEVPPSPTSSPKAGERSGHATDPCGGGRIAFREARCAAIASIASPPPLLRPTKTQRNERKQAVINKKKRQILWQLDKFMGIDTWRIVFYYFFMCTLVVILFYYYYFLFIYKYNLLLFLNKNKSYDSSLDSRFQLSQFQILNLWKIDDKYKAKGEAPHTCQYPFHGLSHTRGENKRKTKTQ